MRDTITLQGTFGFDALSPDASKLYLIQHLTANDIEHYIVRAYDLATHKLMPGRIADKTQKSWVMQGWAVSRVTSADGRWAYTLYANPGGYPFIHALDTVNGRRALRRPAVEAAGPDLRLQLHARPEGERARGGAAGGRTWRLVNRASWRVSTP